MRCYFVTLLLLISVFCKAQKQESIYLILTDQSGKKIENAIIRVLNTENVQIKETNGKYIINNLSKGTYLFEINAFGYSSKFQEVDFSKSNSHSIELSNEAKNLDDIIITGDKRDGNASQTPGSFTSFNSKEIAKLRLWSINDLSGLSPNLNLAQSGDNRNVTFIRGIGSTSYEQGVATYIDGVSQFSLDTYIPQLNDIERIEILRGPQGTLYGRNSMGGVINIITKKNIDKPLSNIEYSFGNFGQQRISLSEKLPIVKNKLLASASVLFDKKNGFYTNDYNNSKFDKQQQNALNLQLKYFLNNKFTILFDHKLYNAKNNGAYPLVSDINELFANPFHLSQDNSTKMNDKTRNTSLTFKYRGNSSELLFQSAFQSNYRFYDNTIDADFSPYNIVGIFNNYGTKFNRVNVFTQEIRWSSSENLQRKIKWTSGLFYYNQKNPSKQATVFGSDAAFIGSPDVNFSLISINKAENTGIAGYGNMNLSINERLSFSTGIRIDNESRKMVSSGEYQKPPSPPIEVQSISSKKTTYIAISPKIGIQYKRTNSSIWYMNYSRGFRSGGITPVSSDPSQLPLQTYLPEFSNNFEAGIRGEEFNKTLKFGFSAFYTIANQVQVPTLILPDAITIIKNAGKLISKGLEFELKVIPAKGLFFSYNGGLTNAKYTRYLTGQNGNIIDLSGKRQIFTPITTNFLSLEYKHLISEKSKRNFVIRSEFKQFGKQFFDVANNIEQKQYGLVNFRTGIETEKFEIHVWIRNLLDQKFIEYAYDFGAAHLGNPRTFGATVKYNVF